MTEQARQQNGPGSADVENFLHRVVTTIKPRLAVQDQNHISFTLALARGLGENGFGKLIAFDSDASRSTQVQEEIATAGFASLVEVRSQSALEGKIEGNIDLLLCSANYREIIQRFLPQINPFGLMLLYGGGNDYQHAREFALGMDQNGTASVLFLPESLQLVMAQKRSGRK